MPRTKGSKKFGAADLEILLKLLKVELPTRSDQWEEVAEQYNALAQAKGFDARDPDRLKRKFKSGYSHKKKTGDPELPDWVRSSKHIRYLIEERLQFEVCNTTCNSVIKRRIHLQIQLL